MGEICGPDAHVSKGKKISKAGVSREVFRYDKQ